MNDNARVFLERLPLDLHQTKQVITCPFHIDTGASFSVDLDRALFYCFGGCDEPKGGGALMFLIKWARVKDGREISRQEARNQLRSVRRVPDAQTLRREQQREELDLFREYATPRLCGELRAIEQAISDIDWLHAREMISEDETWDHLEILYREQCLHDRAFDGEWDVILTVYKQRGWWTRAVELHARIHRKWKDTRHTLLRHLWTLRDAIDENLHEPDLMGKLAVRATPAQAVVLSALRHRFTRLYDEICYDGLSQRQRKDITTWLDGVQFREVTPRTPVPIRTPIPR